MWIRLKSIHEQHSAIDKVTWKSFQSQIVGNWHNRKNVRKIVISTSTSWQWRAMGDIDKIMKTLGSLPMKYTFFVTMWDSYSEAKQTFKNLTIQMLKEQKLNLLDKLTSTFAAVKMGILKPTSMSETARHRNNYNTKIDKTNVECHFKSECWMVNWFKCGLWIKTSGLECWNVEFNSCWLWRCLACWQSQKGLFSMFEEIPDKSVGI